MVNLHAEVTVRTADVITGKRILTGCEDGVLRIWDPRNASPLYSTRRPMTNKSDQNWAINALHSQVMSSGITAALAGGNAPDVMLVNVGMCHVLTYCIVRQWRLSNCTAWSY